MADSNDLGCKGPVLKDVRSAPAPALAPVPDTEPFIGTCWRSERFFVKLKLIFQLFLQSSCSIFNMNQSESSRSEGDDLNPDCASVFNVGSYFIDLGQYLPQASDMRTGWVFASDPTSQPRSVCIADHNFFKSYTKTNEADFDQRTYQEYVLLLKFPRKSQFLLYDVKQWELITVRDGKLPRISKQNTLQRIIDKCLRIVQHCTSINSCQEVNDFILLNNRVSLRKSESLMCKDFLSRSVYDGGNLSHSKAVVELKSTWTVDENVGPEMLYKSLFEKSGCQLKTASKHDLDFKTVNSCEDITEGLSFVCPSKVPVSLAFRVLTKMHDRTWRFLQPVREKSECVLDALFCDIDSGIFYLKAKPHASSLSDIVLHVKSVLTNEILKCQVPYVPSGNFHGITQEKPTIEPVSGGLFVKLPDPEHMTEVAKSWLWMKTMPSEFLTCVQNVMCDVAKEILRLSPLGSTQIALGFLELKHSRVATNVPGGLLMVFSAFLLLSKKYPGLKLVVETYNNKSKGLVSKVDVTKPLDFQTTSVEMQRLILQNNSIFRVISDFCSSCGAELDESTSTISFGFRTIHKDRMNSMNLHSSVKKPDNFLRSAKCQIYPMAFMHTAICPFLCHPEEQGEICRVQVYQEPWSAHKNIHPKQSRKMMGQNIPNAMDGNVLNLSALRSGLAFLAESFDASFQNWHDVSSTRFEVAWRPKIGQVSETSTIFDLQAGLTAVWQYLEASFIFSPIDAVTTYSSVCTAAILVGYRASIDALKDCSNLEANEQGHVVDYMRYLNAIIHTVPSGRFVTNNPKLYLANLGLDSGRVLDLIPTLPLRVQQQIVSYLPGLKFNFDDPQLPLEHSRNVILERIEMLQCSDSLEASMVICSCGTGFFGLDRISKLHKHLSHHPSHNSQNYKGQSINGKDWFATFVKQKQQLEAWLSGHGTIEQQYLFQNVLNGRNTCSVGKAGTGKTFVMKHVDEFLSMIFLYPGEVVRIAPLGRVAQFFHCGARTVHSTMRLYMDTSSWTDEDIVRHLEENKFEVFSRMKVLIGLEMFVMSDCVLSGLLKFIHRNYPETLLLFEGDPIQLSVGTGDPVLCQPEYDRMFDTVVFNTQQRITNSEQQAALDKMRLGQADEGVLAYWKSRIVEQIDETCFTIYALKESAEKHNEIMLKRHETKFATKRIQLFASDKHNGNDTVFPEHIRRNCMVEKVLNIVPKAPVFFTKNITTSSLCSSKEIYVGNGTPATVVKIETGFVTVELECGEQVRVEPISFDIDGGDGYTRTQYPLILGWASSIHKVQGMQFAKVQINFCFRGKNIKCESGRQFYRGMAYMALSRSENIKIVGEICIELLNNVNPYALQYWLRKVQEWSERPSKGKKIVYRDAIHAHNDFCAQSFQKNSLLQASALADGHEFPVTKNFRACGVPQADSSPTTSGSVNVYVSASANFPAFANCNSANSDSGENILDIDDGESTGNVEPASFTDPADENFSGSVLAPAHVTPAAGCQKEGDVVDNDDATSLGQKQRRDESLPLMQRKLKGPAPAFVTAPSPISSYLGTPTPFTARFISSTAASAAKCQAPAPAPDSAPALASARPPCLALAATASKSDLADTHAPAQHNVVIRANHSDSVSKAWKLHDHYLLVKTLWTETHDQIFPKLGQRTWEEGMSFREGSRGYGEASINVCLLMLQVLDDLYPIHLRKTSPPFFVDIGSGLGNIVLQMSALQPDLKCCFGIELERPRAAFAMEACRVFTANASKKDIRFCQIQAQEGNCFEDACCKQALMSAGIVWINNEIFSPDDNLKVFQFLNSLVPVHCIIMSFVELLVTKRSSKTTPQSDQPSDFVVHTPRQLKNACSWFHPEVSKQIFIIQRKTAKFALAKNDKKISSR